LSLAWSPKSERLAIATNEAWWLTSRARAGAPTSPPLPELRHPPEEVRGLCFASEDRLVATYIDASVIDRLVVFEGLAAGAGQVQARYPPKSVEVGNALIRLDDEHVLLGGGRSGQLHRIRLSDFQDTRYGDTWAATQARWLNGLALSQSGGVLTLDYKGRLSLWNLDRVEGAVTWRDLTFAATQEARALCAAQGTLAIGYQDGTVELYADLPLHWP
ncbi:MAG TPA: hypothetical protein DEA08_39555, partial [Planctomycetes bacterium]|nr:hypothetical protein [Planctomycetota bacterium]